MHMHTYGHLCMYAYVYVESYATHMYAQCAISLRNAEV